MTQEDEWVELLTKPMSESELAYYQDVVSDKQFKTMIRAYHSQAAMETAQKLILKFFEEKQTAPEVILFALVATWLDNTCKINPEVFNEEFRNAWLPLPNIFCQALLQHAVGVFNQHRGGLNSEYAPELEEYYQRWQALRPALLDEVEQNEEHFLEQAQEICGRLLYLQTYLLQECKFSMELMDFHNLWTQLLVQNYIFTYFTRVDLYYLMAANWRHMALEITDFLELLQAVRGFEELMDPEKSEQLNALLSGYSLN